MSRSTRSIIFLLSLIIVGLGIYSASKIEVSESINSLPGSSDYKEIKPFLDEGKKAVVLSIGIPDQASDPYHLSILADSFISLLKEESKGLLDSVFYKSELEADELLHFFLDNVYLYLDESDYEAIDSLIQIDNISAAIASNKSQLFSPEGVFLKDIILKDPLHFISLLKGKLLNNANTERLGISDGLFISEDRTKLYFFSRLNYDPSESALNADLSSRLSSFQQGWNEENPEYEMDYFGTFLIANANASQIKKDIMVTVTIAMILILSLLLYYYKNLLLIFLFVLPGVFGILFSISIIYLLQGEVSAIALSASAVIFGIVVDYSFHFFSDLKQSGNAYKTRKQLAFPLLVSGSTTILAFYSLTFAQSKMLNDFGLFTAFSLLGALVFVLGVLPELIRDSNVYKKPSKKNKIDILIGKIQIEGGKRNKFVVVFILLLTLLFSFYASDISFEDDLYAINYHPDYLKKKEKRHQDINPDTQKRINLLVNGKDENDIANKNYSLYAELTKADINAEIQQINSLAPFIIPEKTQLERINRWNLFWEDRRLDLVEELDSISLLNGFKQGSFSSFYSLIDAKETSLDLYNYFGNSQPFSRLIMDENNTKTMLTSLVFEKADYEDIKKHIDRLDYVEIVDGEGIMAMLTDAVKDDFNFLLLAAGIIVLLTMLLIYGSLDLTLITFIPMVISWVWILGLSVILGFKFNFVNIIIATFIFGLGDDFAIFISDGLQSRYKYGRKVLDHYKTGILLSSISTIIGTGVLFFAKHPAIKSIAGISVTGIVSIVIVSFFIQPFLFRLMITGRTENNKAPMSFFGILYSLAGYIVFFIGSISGLIMGFLIRITPFVPTAKKKLALHKVLQVITGFQLNVIVTLKNRKYDFDKLDFSSPSILIANHSSFYDILALVRLNPKIVMMVNHWVYNSRLFGAAIRYADYLPSFQPIDENLEKIEELIKEGYSIAIFPEGSRSQDGKIKRFHKGAFYISEKLAIPVTPILLHGFSYTMPKHDYYQKGGFISTKVLDRINPNDNSFGMGYKERSKSISKYFKNEFAQFSDECEEKDFQFYPLKYGYKYKGPILEWYFRIKWKFEKENYETYNQIIGKGPKTIYDLGCGYGFLSYFLSLRDESRIIYGIDYDEEKIEVAQNVYFRTDKISFSQGDLRTSPISNCDVVILADVLHYLDKEAQLALLNRVYEYILEGGKIIIRDGVADDEEGHEWTKKSENWSTNLIRFNKTSGELSFFTRAFIYDWAKKKNLNVELVNKSKKSSNTLFVLSK